MVLWVGFVITPWLAAYSTVVLCLGLGTFSFGLIIMLGVLVVSFRADLARPAESSVRTQGRSRGRESQ